MTSQSQKPILYIITNNHFDPTWRRCWDRHFTWNGKTFISYADIEEYYLLDNIEIAQQNPEYKFNAEFTLVVQKFFERHPEKRGSLIQLAGEGRFSVTGGGQVIVDANMILGESLVRNYLYGLLWVENNLGLKTHLAVRNDGFGNSAQIPQILRGCEITWATGLSYSPAKGKYWRGLDGSTILHATLPAVASGGDVIKYAPCQACGGTGCVTCHNRGIDDSIRSRLPGTIDPEPLSLLGAGFVRNTPEELLPNPEIINWANQLRNDYDVRFGLEEDALRHIQPWLEVVDTPPLDELHPGIELNPNNSGVWVTRIKTKQNVRRQEVALLTAEGLAVLATLKGSGHPHDALHQVWNKLLFTQFHDAITATHVDPSYVEIQDWAKEIDVEIAEIRKNAVAKLVKTNPKVVSVLNLTSAASTQICCVEIEAKSQALSLQDLSGELIPILNTRQKKDGSTEITFLARDVPPMATHTYMAIDAEPVRNYPLQRPVIENQRYLIEADDQGIVSVWDKRLERFVLQSDEFRPGELILEHDEGSPWATIHPDQTRTPLSAYTRLVAVQSGNVPAKATPAYQKMVFEVAIPWSMGFGSRNALHGKIEVTLVDGLDRIDFHAKVNWATYNHRLRVAFPIPTPGKHFYEIPYGFLERAPYKPWFTWAGANGDWPAINWAGVQGSDFSLAVFNKGTPSYRMEAGKSQGEVIMLSVLRSPAIPTYLHEPEYYSMTAFDGMRDEGLHEFEYAVKTYAEPFDTCSVITDAGGFNAGLVVLPGQIQIPHLPTIESKNIRIAAIKMAEKPTRRGDDPSPEEVALVLRLVEFRGKGGEATVYLPEFVSRAARINLLERQAEPIEISNHRVVLSLRAWEITTLKLYL